MFSEAPKHSVSGKISLKSPNLETKRVEPGLPVAESGTALKNMTEEERRIERAKKFNAPLSVEDKRKLRGER